MTSSVFEPKPVSLREPPALRRQKVASYPGGEAALALRDRVMDKRNAADIRRFEQSDVGRRSAAVLRDLHDSQRGQVGVIVCNGPSINETDLDLVADHPYLLMNRGYLLADRLPRPPAALCVSADLVLEQYGAEIAAIEAPLLLSSQHQGLVSRTENVAFVHPHRGWQFASQLGSSMHVGYTVTFAALQMAFHLGWDTCLIVGMDHRYDQTGDPTRAVTTQGQDRNHFDPNYFEHGAKWLLPALEMNEYSYRLTRAAYEDHGRRVVDCTVGGACPVFERGTLAVELNA